MVPVGRGHVFDIHVQVIERRSLAGDIDVVAVRQSRDIFVSYATRIWWRESAKRPNRQRLFAGWFGLKDALNRFHGRSDCGLNGEHGFAGCLERVEDGFGVAAGGGMGDEESGREF